MLFYSFDNTKIVDCYKLNNNEIEKRINELYDFRKEKSLPITRTKSSYKNELKAHKILYIIGVKRNHTKDADLEENIAWWKEIVYAIIGF